MVKNSEIKVLVEPELRTRMDAARGLVPLSAWVRDAIERKLEEWERDFRRPVVPSLQTPLDVTGEMEEWDRYVASAK